MSGKSQGILKWMVSGNPVGVCIQRLGGRSTAIIG